MTKPDVIKAALSVDSVIYKDIWNAAIKSAVEAIIQYENDLINNFEKVKGISASTILRKLKK